MAPPLDRLQTSALQLPACLPVFLPASLSFPLCLLKGLLRDFPCGTPAMVGNHETVALGTDCCPIHGLLPMNVLLPYAQTNVLMAMPTPVPSLVNLGCGPGVVIPKCTGALWREDRRLAGYANPGVIPGKPSLWRRCGNTQIHRRLWNETPTPEWVCQP